MPGVEGPDPEYLAAMADAKATHERVVERGLARDRRDYLGGWLSDVATKAVEAREERQRAGVEPDGPAPLSLVRSIAAASGVEPDDLERALAADPDAAQAARLEGQGTTWPVRQVSLAVDEVPGETLALLYGGQEEWWGRVLAQTDALEECLHPDVNPHDVYQTLKAVTQTLKTIALEGAQEEARANVRDPGSTA